MERAIEPEFVPMAHALGMGLTVWSPLGGGLLTGEYRRTADGLGGAGRLAGAAAVSDRDWRVVDALRRVADGLGRSMAQVAVNWVATQPAVASAPAASLSWTRLRPPWTSPFRPTRGRCWTRPPRGRCRSRTRCSPCSTSRGSSAPGSLLAVARRMQASGEMPGALDADRAAAGLLAGVQGGVLLLLSSGRTEHLEAALDLAFTGLRGSATGRW
ncbi:aldo/keto reductase [Actinoplanes philippinensis]|uniref:aldo/keto reductase n=1 Tax=Actinoplanes philippinensis TaxID=35752 RepID=UPI0033C7F118